MNKIENRKLKIENGKRCDNCVFSIFAIGQCRPMLICKQRDNFVGKRRVVRLDDTCKNFYPSTDLKYGRGLPRLIPVTRGMFAIVDADDYYQLVKYKWHINSNKYTPYASRRSGAKTLKMHRVIMAAPDHLVVDHIDHNGLNNCKSNLRLCTPAQNRHNCGSNRGATSRYKGVSWRKDAKKWEAMIRYNKKMYRLGAFKNEIQAAKAYDKKAAQLHGEFAHLNLPPTCLPRRSSDSCEDGSSRAQPRDLLKIAHEVAQI